MEELIVLLSGERAGVLVRQKAGSLLFRYEDAWRDDLDAYPLSLSMPLSRREHPDSVVRPYLEGLLPDNRAVLERWARDFQVSPGNPFALLAHMGEDCPGAVQLVRPERFEALSDPSGSSVQWLSENEIADRLREMVDRNGTGRRAGDRGQFSLSGAQPKTALFHDGRRWGIPTGAIPTTHILKPPAQADLDGFDVNEHFCLRLSAELGLDAAQSTVREFAGETTIVVERYDRRVDADGRVTRVHQEDACQALGIAPWMKYENEGGPGAVDVVALLMRESVAPEADLGSFIDAMALNWVIAGTDAHAKNYSVLISPRTIRLAPLYDVISLLPYSERYPPRKSKLAMRVDREYSIWKIRRRHWEGLATRCGLDPGPVAQRVAELVGIVPAAAAASAEALRSEGIVHGMVDRLQEAITRHAEHCLTAMG